MGVQRLVLVNRFFYPDHSATSQLLSDLAFGLAAKGRQVHVVTSRQSYDDPRVMLAAYQEVDGVEIHRVWTSRFGRANLVGRALDYLTFYLTAVWRVARLVHPGDIVVAKTDPPMLSLITAPICRLRGARLVNWLQDVFPELAIALGVAGLHGTLGRAIVRLRNWSLREAACNVVVGHRMHDYLEARDSLSKRFRVIENWADGQLVRPVPADENVLRREWGVESRFVVGYSGNMGRVHDFATILGAAERLRNDDSTVFLFIGGGRWRDWIEGEAQRRALHNILFKPYQPRERLRESLSVPDVHLISLRPELEGLVVPSKFYGVAAAGRPTIFIGAADGETGQLLHRYDCGCAVCQGDDMRLASCIRQLRDDPPLRHRLGDNARRVFENRFDKHIALESWCRLLDDLGAAVA